MLIPDPVLSLDGIAIAQLCKHAVAYHPVGWL
jgi:hypothetical protein